MENKFEHIEEIIAKFLAGEASPGEIGLLEEWKNLNAENAKEYSQFEKIFSMSSNLDEIISVDTDKAWQKVKESLNHSSSKGKIISLKTRNQYTAFLRIAAIFLLIAGLSIAIFFLIGQHEAQLTNIDSGDSIKVKSLPDGSMMTLNKNSSIAFSENSFLKKRIVKLKGEAFFEIKHDSLSPFVVETAELSIEDIGTAFNVKAREGNDFVIISVTSGEVKITTKNDNSVFLSAGEEVSYKISTRSMATTKITDNNIAAYKDKIFIFDNAELVTVANVLNEIYNVKLTFENENLKHCHITVSFNNEKIEDIADVIAETLGLTLKKEGDKIIFEGDGCK